jgi:HAD superfamily hydrolase (TIGR01484 family)
MKNLYLFDVDGTIADSGQIITTDMATVLQKLKSNNCEIGIVGGGKLDKVLEQMDNKIFFDHYFTECGSIYNKNIVHNSIQLKEIYKKNIRDHPLYNKINLLIKACLQYLSQVDYTLTGHFIDLRNGLIYVSLIGLTATQEERRYFMNLDKINHYRKNLIKLLQTIATNLQIIDEVDIVEGGSVGIAIYPIEYDKIQVLDSFSENEYDKIYYFGDKYGLNGNDYKLLHHPRVAGYKVNNYNDTIDFINGLNYKI